MPNAHHVPASDIERETGFGKDLLRKWRQRYGFPEIETTADGKVGYSRKTVNQLLSIKRLLEGGFRPASVVGKTPLELERLRRGIADRTSDQSLPESTIKLIDRLKNADLGGFQTLLAKYRSQETLTEYVVKTIAPLLTGVGDAWSRGDIEVYHEHFCSSLIQRWLHAEILSLKPRRGLPCVLFATPPDEHHALGLMMAEAVLADLGAKCFCLGTHVPLNDLKLAAMACKADIVALSFSFAYPARLVRPVLLHLRHLLPEHVQIWSGGAGASIIRRPPKGVRIFLDIEDILEVL